MLSKDSSKLVSCIKVRMKTGLQNDMFETCK